MTKLNENDKLMLMYENETYIAEIVNINNLSNSIITLKSDSFGTEPEDFFIDISFDRF